MRIKDCLEDERPREKLLAKGPAALSNSELLAILLRSGTVEKNAVELAGELLRLGDGSLSMLGTFSVQRMASVRGIGKWKAAEICAAIEIGRRFFAEKPASLRKGVCRPADVYEQMIPRMRGLPEEECWVLFLSRTRSLICKEKMSAGGDSQTVVDVRKICLRAMELHAAALVLVHNHPSGSSRPGREDMKATGALRSALSAIDITLLDHIVIADGEYFSFADERVYFPEKCLREAADERGGGA